MKPASVLDLVRSASSSNKSKPSNRITFGILILLAVFLLYLALRGINWDVFISSIYGANYGYLPLIFIWGSISSWVRAIRWRVLLTTDKEILVKNVFWANMAGYLGNTILPARAGELIRAAYLSRENNLSAPFSLATGLVERFIDLIALVILGSVSLAVAGILSGPLQDAIKVMAGISGFGIVALFLLPYVGRKFSQVVNELPGLQAPVREKISGLLNQFLRGVEALQNPGRAIQFIFFTALIWCMDAVGVIILARALHLDFVLSQSFLLLAALGLSSAIPSTPGYVGIYQFVAVIILQPFGISNAQALAFIIFLQAMNLFIVIFWGGIAVWRTSPLKNL